MIFLLNIYRNKQNTSSKMLQFGFTITTNNSNNNRLT